MTSLTITDKEHKEDEDLVEFSLGDVITVVMEGEVYRELSRHHSDEVIVSSSEEKLVVNDVTGRELVYVSEAAGIPLYGHIAFGIIDRGTNLIQVRPMTGCNLNCIFCSACEGPESELLKTDYVVDLDYLMDELEQLVSRKGEGVEVHIDGQGEPGFYPDFKELVRRAKQLKEVEVVSVQTNGHSLNEEDIGELEGWLDRINLSLNTLGGNLAEKMSGKHGYDLQHVKKLIHRCVDSGIDILIAPVWVPGVNDDDMIDMIEFSKSNIENERWPVLGIQKYVPYKRGRRLDVGVMSFYRFYKELKRLEEKFDTKLRLRPEDFDIEYRRSCKERFSKGERIRASLKAPGRRDGEMIAVARDRALSVETEKQVGEEVTCKVVRTKHDIYHAVGS
ncbi:MAG: radical SAM protein [Candidatus Aenigmatarchaeota archaeon]